MLASCILTSTVFCNKLMELVMIRCFGAILGVVNLLRAWILIGYCILITSNLVKILLLLVGYGRLIMVGFIIVIPNGLVKQFYPFFIVIFLTGIFVPIHLNLLVLLLVFLVVFF